MLRATALAVEETNGYSTHVVMLFPMSCVPLSRKDVPMSAPSSTAASLKSPLRAYHHVVRIVYIVVYSFLGLNILGSVGQAILQTGTFPSWRDIQSTFVVGWAEMHPFLALPLIVALVAIAIFGPIYDSRQSQHHDKVVIHAGETAGAQAGAEAGKAAGEAAAIRKAEELF